MGFTILRQSISDTEQTWSSSALPPRQANEYGNYAGQSRGVWEPGPVWLTWSWVRGGLLSSHWSPLKITEELISSPHPRYPVFRCIEEGIESPRNPRHGTSITVRTLPPLTWWQPTPVVQKEVRAQCERKLCTRRTGDEGIGRRQTQWGDRQETDTGTEKEGQKLTKVSHCRHRSSSLTNSTTSQTLPAAFWEIRWEVFTQRSSGPVEHYRDQTASATDKQVRLEESNTEKLLEKLKTMMLYE